MLRDVAQRSAPQAGLKAFGAKRRERSDVVRPLAPVQAAIAEVVSVPRAVRGKRFGVVKPLASVRKARVDDVSSFAEVVSVRRAVRGKRFGVVKPLTSVRKAVVEVV